MHALHVLGAAALLGGLLVLPGRDEALEASFEELRHCIGTWRTTTEFLDENGSVAATVEGEYTFDWVVEDRVVSGRSDLPQLGMSAGILFYVNADARTIEMVSVGADGQLWVMTGPVGGDTRTTQIFQDAQGRDSRLRFTRHSVEPDRFESRMERTTDGGATWLPGNRQVFVRKD